MYTLRMNYRFFKLKRIVLLLLLLLILSPSSVLAQSKPGVTPVKLSVPKEAPPSGIDLSLSPTYLTLRANPGENVSSEFKISNNNSFPEYLKITLSKFSSSNSGRPVLAPLDAGDEFASWFETPETEFKLNPGQTKTLSISLSPPKDAALGYYYAVVVSRITEGENKDSAILTGSVALPVLLDVVSKNAKRELQIVDFKTESLFYEYLPANFTVTFKNTGNIHVIPTGDIFIDSLFNKDVATIQVNEGRGNVLPGGERTFINSWNEGFATRVMKTKDGQPIKNKKGENEYETKFDFARANEFRFGRYTAHMLVVYDNGERDIPMEATVSFWVIPWKIIGGLLVIVLLAAVGLLSILLPILKKARK